MTQLELDQSQALSDAELEDVGGGSAVQANVRLHVTNNAGGPLFGVQFSTARSVFSSGIQLD